MVGVEYEEEEEVIFKSSVSDVKMFFFCLNK